MSAAFQEDLPTQKRFFQQIQSIVSKRAPFQMMSSMPDPITLLIGRLLHPLTFVDVGARWGPPQPWSVLGSNAKIISFEPDAVECDRINSISPPYAKCLPYALGDNNDNVDIFVTRFPACSSTYKPIKNLYEKYWLEYITPDHVVNVPCRTMDGILADAAEEVDCIKLDTQGSELDILRGAKRSVANCSLIDVEVEFNEIYENQNLFCDVDRFLRNSGFVLWRLSELAHYADRSAPKSATNFRLLADPFQDHQFAVENGQLFWAQARYVRAEFPPTSNRVLTMEQSIRASIVVALYGYWDLALEIIRKGGDGALARDINRVILDRMALGTATAADTEINRS